jgi:heat shock protein HslJ
MAFYIVVEQKLSGGEKMMHTFKRLMILMASLTLALSVACTSTGEQTATAGGQQQGDDAAGAVNASPTPDAVSNPLIDTEWVLAGWGSQDAPQTPLPGTPVTIQFRDGDLEGSAGCNSYFGSYETDGKALAIGQVGNTEMWCEGLMEQETAFLELLQTAQTFELADNRLVIESAEGVLIFEQPEPTPEPPLTGTVWVLDALSAGDTVQSVLAGTTVTLEFTDEKASGATGCNHYGASYSLEEGGITFGVMEVTLQDCGAEIMAQEAAYLAALGSAETFTLEGGALAIHSPDGGLVFKVAENLPMEGTDWILEGIAQGDAIVSTWIDPEISAVFDDGQVTGFAGCNQYFASYETDGTALSLGPIGSTEKSCEDERMQREGDFLGALGAVAGYTIKMDTLTLSDAAGDSLLVFRAQGDTVP